MFFQQTCSRGILKYLYIQWMQFSFRREGCSITSKSDVSLMLVSGMASKKMCFPRCVLWNLCCTYTIERATSRNCIERFMDINFGESMEELYCIEPVCRKEGVVIVFSLLWNYALGMGIWLSWWIQRSIHIDLLILFKFNAVRLLSFVVVAVEESKNVMVLGYLSGNLDAQFDHLIVI